LPINPCEERGLVDQYTPADATDDRVEPVRVPVEHKVTKATEWRPRVYRWPVNERNEAYFGLGFY